MRRTDVRDDILSSPESLAGDPPEPRPDGRDWAAVTPKPAAPWFAQTLGPDRVQCQMSLLDCCFAVALHIEADQ